MEAMACGVPVLASCTGSISELITHGHDGLLCRPGSIAALHAGLSWLLEPSGRRAEFSLRARARAEAAFELDHHSVTLGRMIVDLTALS
jgi:glycosyltransferase involved in cell wall biosynthesis